MKIKSYKDLNIWKRSIEVVEDIYKITKNFPKEEIRIDQSAKKVSYFNSLKHSRRICQVS